MSYISCHSCIMLRHWGAHWLRFSSPPLTLTSWEILISLEPGAVGGHVRTNSSKASEKLSLLWIQTVAFLVGTGVSVLDSSNRSILLNSLFDASHFRIFTTSLVLSTIKRRPFKIDPEDPYFHTPMIHPDSQKYPLVYMPRTH